MPIKNVGRILCFEITNGATMRPAEFKAVANRRFVPDGANDYIGINDHNIEFFDKSGKTQALNPNHLDLLVDPREHITSTGKGVTLMIGLEPPKYCSQVAPIKLEKGRSNPFGFVLQHLDFVGKLAEELHKEQLQTVTSGKPKLQIVVRFASEMNDKTLTPSAALNLKCSDQLAKERNCWGQKTHQFITAFTAVRAIFKDRAPHIQFAFSPSIRVDLAPEANTNSADFQKFVLSNYWFGRSIEDELFDDLVDIVSCTWYVGHTPIVKNDQDAFDKSLKFLGSYLQEFKKYGKPLAFDEFGTGKSITDRQTMLERMVTEVENGQLGKFEYLTFFLEGLHGNIDISQWA